jgi:tRNA-dihydrouridine synthase B
VLDVMERHLAALWQAYGEAIGVRIARKHIGWYLDGRRGATEVRRLLMRAESGAEQLSLLRSYFLGHKAGAEQAAGAGRLAA